MPKRRHPFESGRESKQASKGGFTPVIFAAQRGEPKTVENLLNAGADINHAVPGGMNALLISVTAQKRAAAEVLIAHGASVGSKDRTGNTPLHIAAQLGIWS